MDYLKDKIFVSLSTILAIALFTVWYRKKRQVIIPQKWKEVGSLGDLMCFPIKSCGPTRLKSMKCTKLGLKSGLLRDRNFAVIDLQRKCMSAKNHSKLVLIQPMIENDYLILEAPTMSILKINIPILNQIRDTKIIVCKIPIKAKDCGDEAAEWFSKYVLNSETGLRLIFYPPEEEKNNTNFVRNDETGIFPDVTSYNILNESSVDDLNKRLERNFVVPQNFRPNFVVKGAKPLEEDTWEWVKIGEVIFQVVRPCTRCIITTVNTETGMRNSSGEPLKTLKTYRKMDDPRIEECEKNCPVMGVYLALRKEGDIALGDKVYAVK